ncbi:hypothetical protein MASR2M12_12060 [Bacteroidales bacterium]
MKKALYLIVSSIFLFIGIGCTQKPNELEVIDLIKSRYNNSFIIDINVQSVGKSTKKDNVTLFPYTIQMNYIRPGLAYGYVSGCPERHCIEDTEIKETKAFLLGKDEWDKWKIYDSKIISDEKIQTIWRPESISMQEFYKNRTNEKPAQNSKSAEEIAESLSTQVMAANERVNDEWNKTISLYNQRNQIAYDLIANVEDSKNGTTNETRELLNSLDKFKATNQSDELLTNGTLFDVFVMQTEDISFKLSKVFSIVERNKVNDSYLKIEANLEGLENRIAVQRRNFNEIAQEYNISFNKKVKSDNEVYIIFIKNYPNLCSKCYFKPKDNTAPAPSVKF